MQLTKEEVRKIARLARLDLTDQEVESYTGQITSILNYVSVLEELDTASVPETSQVTGLSLTPRPDEEGESLCTPDELLLASPLPTDEHQIRVKRVI